MFIGQAFLGTVQLPKQFKNASPKHSTSFGLFVIDELLDFPSSNSKGKGGLIARLAPGNWSRHRPPVGKLDSSPKTLIPNHYAYVGGCPDYNQCRWLQTRKTRSSNCKPTKAPALNGQQTLAQLTCSSKGVTATRCKINKLIFASFLYDLHIHPDFVFVICSRSQPRSTSSHNELLPKPN